MKQKAKGCLRISFFISFLKLLNYEQIDRISETKGVLKAAANTQNEQIWTGSSSIDLVWYCFHMIKKQKFKKKKILWRSKDGALTLDTRVVGTEAKPVSITINGGEIVYVEVHWRRSTHNLDWILSAQHVSKIDKPKKEFKNGFAKIDSFLILGVMMWMNWWNGNLNFVLFMETPPAAGYSRGLCFLADHQCLYKSGGFKCTHKIS